MASYSWGDYKHFLNPQIAGERIQQLSTQAGEHLTPALVVDDARAPASPLHPAFEWDDTVAAEKYRVSQARTLINSLRVTIESTDDASARRMFVNVSIRTEDDEEVTNERYYTPVVVALSDVRLRATVLEQARKELASFQAKYHEIQELADVFAAIDRTMFKVPRKGRRRVVVSQRREPRRSIAAAQG